MLTAPVAPVGVDGRAETVQCGRRYFATHEQNESHDWDHGSAGMAAQRMVEGGHRALLACGAADAIQWGQSFLSCRAHMCTHPCNMLHEFWGFWQCVEVAFVKKVEHHRRRSRKNTLTVKSGWYTKENMRKQLNWSATGP